MHTSNRLLAAAAIAALAVQALPGRAAEQVVPQAATWQAHHATLIYEPYTSQYTCDGLRSKVREIFLFLGARKDLKIVASGCGPSEFPMGAASVNVDFSTLAAAPDAPDRRFRLAEPGLSRTVHPPRCFGRQLQIAGTGAQDEPWCELRGAPGAT